MTARHLAPLVATLVMAAAQAGAVVLGAADEMIAPEAVDVSDRVLFDFASPDGMDQWQIVNDGVMGGLSQSRMSATDGGTAIFEGTLSLGGDHEAQSHTDSDEERTDGNHRKPARARPALHYANLGHRPVGTHSATGVEFRSDQGGAVGRLPGGSTLAVLVRGS